MDVSPPLLVTFETTHTRIPLSFTLLDDELEEGYENFTLKLSYNGADDTVRIMNERAEMFIKDDDGKFNCSLANTHYSFKWSLYSRLLRKEVFLLLVYLVF